jgi:hypothetical protein
MTAKILSLLSHRRLSWPNILDEPVLVLPWLLFFCSFIPFDQPIWLMLAHAHSHTSLRLIFDAL